MIRHDDSRLNDRDARALLQRLRDLNLGACAIDVSLQERVRLEGCLSADAPVERGVHYRLRRSDGRAEVLSLECRAGRISIARGSDFHGRENQTTSELTTEIFADRFGRVAVPELGARLDLWSIEVRELEHFLRRLVRASFNPRA